MRWMGECLGDGLKSRPRVGRFGSGEIELATSRDRKGCTTWKVPVEQVGLSCSVATKVEVRSNLFEHWSGRIGLSL